MVPASEIKPAWLPVRPVWTGLTGSQVCCCCEQEEPGGDTRWTSAGPEVEPSAPLAPSRKGALVLRVRDPQTSPGPLERRGEEHLQQRLQGGGRPRSSCLLGPHRDFSSGKSREDRPTVHLLSRCLLSPFLPLSFISFPLSPPALLSAPLTGSIDCPSSTPQIKAYFIRGWNLQ